MVFGGTRRHPCRVPCLRSFVVLALGALFLTSDALAGPFIVPLRVKPGVSLADARERAAAAIASAARATDYWQVSALCSAGSTNEEARCDETSGSIVVCEVPAFGWSIGVNGFPKENSGGVVQVILAGASEEECGWLCVRLLRADCLGGCRECLDLRPLTQRVLDHYGRLPPPAGTDAGGWAAASSASRCVCVPGPRFTAARDGVAQSGLVDLVRREPSATVRVQLKW